MRRNSLAGLIGLVLIIFGLVDHFIARGFTLFVLVNIVLGVLAIVVWALSSRDLLASMATRRATRYGANALIYSIAFIAVLIAINYISSLHHHRFDMTAEKIYSLSPQSVQVVRELKQPIRFYGFFRGGHNPAARKLYQEYAYASPKVSYQMVDPDRHPEIAERYKVSVMNTTHIQYGSPSLHQGTNVTDLTESAITNALLRVVRGRAKIACYLYGHGEPNIDQTRGQRGFGDFRRALEGEGYHVRKLLLATQAAVPDDCTLLVVAGPIKPLLPHEVGAINDYLKKGGRAVVMLRPPRPDQSIDESALVKLVSGWGVEPGNNVVVDQVVRLFAGPALGLNPLVGTYDPSSPVTKGFNQRTVFPMTRSVLPAQPEKSGLSVVALAKTSPTSWGETDLAGVFEKGRASLGPTDLRGPIVVADSVDADLAKLDPGGKGQARLIVLGSTEFADNQYLDNFYNRDFLMNGVDWLAGEANQISIRPRRLRASRFRLTVGQFSIVFALSVLLLPEILLILGIAAWWERRN